ncbi:DUF4232 domain-containing protein [Dactylosporangium aurantiacum]|uniref:DUF4232 domain-containing protein n=1 Tax=Dactylosporangium aurantiacum TaxID=35754 RepID=A0A9Q9IDW3_9ACTN|nr:DUF4232 domain-containing protein [Dactylosporangium aurantiacum]MDG6101449.1 DUF4232 domain-containing protein [Dactylosporangium aurantiacum]UWZ52698.1 DUF4232 domain-containing protein [Dactylosporangium aurantiacum]
MQARRLLPTLASALAAAAVLTGCGTTPAHPDQTVARPDVSAPDMVPATTPPPTTPPTSAAPSPQCLAPGVTLSVGEVDAAMGLRAVGITLRNCGAATYTVQGYPDVDVLDADRRVLDVTVLDGTSNVAMIERYDAPPKRVTVRPGGTAVAVLVWRNLTTDAATVAKGAYVSVAPAGGQARHVLALDVDPGNTGRLAVSPWTAP